MLINDLAKAYDRLSDDPDCKINQDGFCYKPIENLAIINKEGVLLEIITIEKPQVEKVPENLTPGGIKNNIIYDNFEYFFGLKLDGGALYPSIDGKSKQNKFESFKNANLNLLQDVSSDMAMAIKTFLNSWLPEENTDNPCFFSVDEDGRQKARVLKGNISFCLENAYKKCYKDQEITNKIKENITKNNDATIDGICAITGKAAKIAKNHKSFSGSQNYLISVDNDSKSFHSYGKTWCYNSPVSEEIMNKYTAALNYFFRSGSKNKTSFGDDILMFWSQDMNHDCQDETLALLGQAPDNNEVIEDTLSSALSQIKSGIVPNVFKTPPETNFFLLLLSKNAARFAIRKYHRTTFGNFRDNILCHYLDMQIDGSKKPTPIWQLLDATTSSTSNSKPNPSFGGALMDVILNNSMYPSTIFAEMINRFKTDNPNLDNALKRSAFIGTSIRRVAFIKAYLARKNRLENKKEDITMSLNLQSENQAYLLGRMFAVLEKAQQDAIQGINSTIKDRYFASACSTPAAVFPIILMGYQNHIAKLERGKGRYEKLVGEIINKLDETLPKQLDLNEQGRFIIGYYQQKTDLWTKKIVDENNNNNN